MRLRVKSSIAQLVTATIATLVILIVALLAWSQTEIGKHHLTGVIEAIFSGDDNRLDMEGLTGHFPFNIQVDRLTISDKQGTWLSIQNIAFHWSPRGLLTKRVVIKKLGATDLYFHRLPQGATTGPKTIPRLPGWPGKMPRLEVDRFYIHRAEIGTAVCGQPATFAMNGTVAQSNSKGNICLTLRLDRTDGSKDSASLTVFLAQSPLSLRLHAGIKEAAHGFFASLLGLNSGGAFVFSLSGGGPLDAWEGTLFAKADQAGSITSRISATFLDGLTITSHGTFLIHPPPLPDVLKSLAASETDFSLAVHFDSPDIFSIRLVELNNSLFHCGLRGSLEIGRKMARGSFHLGFDDVAALKNITGFPLSGRLSLTGTMTGLLQEPQLTIDAVAEHAAIGDFGMEVFHGTFQLNASRPGFVPFQGLHVIGTGRIRNPSYPPFDKLLEPVVLWTMTAEVDSDGSVKIRGLELSQQDLVMSLSGSADLRKQTLLATTSINSTNLPRIFGAGEILAAGEGSLRGQISFNGAKPSLNSCIEVRLTHCEPRRRSFSPLIGGNMDSSASIIVSPDGTCTISDLRINTPHATLDGYGSFSLSEKLLTAHWHLQIPRLEAFSLPVGIPLRGKLYIDCELDGPLSEPDVLIAAKGEELLISTVQFGRLESRLHSHGRFLQSQGEIDLDLSHKKLLLQAKTDFVLSDHTIIFSGLSLNTTGASASGNMNIAFSPFALKTSLNGHAAKHSLLAHLTNGKIDGALVFDLHATIDRTLRDISLSLDAEEASFPFGKAQKITTHVKINGPSHQLKGVAQIHINDFRKDRLVFDSADLELGGNTQQVTFHGKASGKLVEELDLTTAGSIYPSHKNGSLVVDVLKCRHGPYPLELLKPVKIQFAPKICHIGEIHASFASGQITAKGLVEKDSLTIVSSYANIPLKPLEWLGLPILDGTATGTINCNGNLMHPVATVDFSSNNMRLSSITAKKIFALELTISGKIEKGTSQFLIILTDSAGVSFEAETKLPLIFSLVPFHISVPHNENIGGYLKGAIDLAMIPPFFHLDDHMAEGRCNLELALSGTPEAIALTGSGSVQEGRYENIRTGTIIKNISAGLQSEGRKLFLRSLDARDNDKGTLAATGWFDLDPINHFPFYLALDLRNASLVRLPDFTGTETGTIHLSGTFLESELTGTVTVENAELRLLKSYMAEITDLEVIEITTDTKSHTIGQPHPSPGSSLMLNLECSFPGRFYILGRGLDSEWKGALKITGPLPHPKFTGELNVVRGFYDLFDKRFRLSRGNITSMGTDPPSLHLSVVAEKKQNDMTARIHLLGNPSDLRITLESEPSMPSDEILARVLFGRNSATITPIQAIQLAHAMETLAGKDTNIFGFMDYTRKLLKVDRLTLEQRSGENTATSLNVGKYLREGMYVEVDKRLDSQEASISVEAEITPNVTVESETGTRSQGGIGLNYKFDY
ncbi:MAG: translocation/assembly module TamB domain-containing protein [Deltaproteobacteria bacterium]|nr:translocation/assembly module TamB domain-containing protein [Deltaproteobacteria bacterium]